MTNIAQRMSGIAPFHVMELMARANALEAAGKSIIHLEVGEPDFATAEPILEAAQRFLRLGHVHYTPAMGLMALRKGISDYYRERHGLQVAAERIIITAGASGALLLALGVLVSPGDEWLLPDPGYPCNRHFVRLLEGAPRPIPVGPETNYQPTAEMVSSAWRTKTRGVMIASPANPTGAVIAPQRLREIAETVHQFGGSLLVDEIYHGLTYGEPPPSALAISDGIFVINSFSKYFGMTGWRLGWLVAPERYVRDIEKLAQNIFIAPSTVGQHAALAAFHPTTIEILERRRREFLQRRDSLISGLRRLGFGIAADPEGAFYIYANCAGVATSSRQLAEGLLVNAGVAVTPGLDFGDHGSDSHLRFAYTASEEKITEALRRIEAFLHK